MAPYVQPPRGGAGYVSIHRTNVHKLANKLLINIHTQGYRCAAFSGKIDMCATEGKCEVNSNPGLNSALVHMYIFNQSTVKCVNRRK